MRKRILAATTAVSVMLTCTGVASAQDENDEDFISPPVNPLPSLFSVSIDGNNAVPTIPPPINPLPAKDVYIQTKTEETFPSIKHREYVKSKKPTTKTVTKKKSSKKGGAPAAKKTSKKAAPKKKSS